MTRVLHIVPTGVFENTYHGAYKDTISRVRWFEKRCSDYRQVAVRVDAPAVLDAHLVRFEPTHILFEYSRFPAILCALKHRFPAARIGVRSHNAEPLQHLDNCGWRNPRGPVWLLYGMARLFLQDAACKRQAHVIYAINDHEQRVYWSRIPGRARVEWLPYFCPDPLIPQRPLPRADRRLVACLPTSSRNRRSLDLVERFQRLAAAMEPAAGPVRFVMTGDLAGWGVPESRAVERLGMLDDIAPLLGQAAAVAMLSPLGHGFKTTLADAMAAGAIALAHPRLRARCPALMQPPLLAVDTERLPAPEQFFREMAAMPEPRDVHRELKGRAYRILEHDFT